MSWNRRIIASAAVLGVLAASTAAEAGRRDRVVAGPIIGGIAANNGYYAYGPYHWPGSALGWSPLYGPAVPVPPGCYMQRQRIWTEYGWRWRLAPICY
jgi:hypothetical protein